MVVNLRSLRVSTGAAGVARHLRYKAILSPLQNANKPTMDDFLGKLADTSTAWDEQQLHVLKSLALERSGLPSHARGLAWRFFLHVLPPTREGGASLARDKLGEWPVRLQAARQQYADWKQQLYPDFTRVSKEGDDDPLSALTAAPKEELTREEVEEGKDGEETTKEGSKDKEGPLRREGSKARKPGAGEGGAWRRYYAGLELLEEVRRDLSRLYPLGVDEAHFTRPKAQEMLLAVLFVWASLHQATSYRQGMHEVAAVLLYVLEAEGGGEGGREGKRVVSGTRMEEFQAPWRISLTRSTGNMTSFSSSIASCWTWSPCTMWRRHPPLRPPPLPPPAPPPLFPPPRRPT
ncbi:Rab-GTPase-TBC domain protein [Nannochloropsis gaditana]|uniref:Rab-GTPase-TBC domain protein n=1 Tax=Nannochloropsis gaditana TaxID=72520 RepID=W7TN55_9STRA|nr:Rab-GTPase-TBC domain protein [Nannochloropsis gaditana]